MKIQDDIIPMIEKEIQAANCRAMEALTRGDNAACDRALAEQREAIDVLIDMIKKSQAESERKA